MYHWWYWLVIGVCSIFSAFFSASDSVYGLADKSKLKKLADKNNRKAKLALYLAENYEFSISTILFGNNIVNILASSLVTAISVAINPEIGATIGSICFTIFIIIFGEFVPKAFAKRFCFKLSLIFAYPVRFFEILFFIFVWPISKFFALFVKLFSKKSKEEDIIDEAVLNEMVDSIEETGEIEENEAEIVRSAIDLNDIEAYEIMTPRVDVYSIDVNDDFDELISQGDLFKHSRVPVYEDTIDNIIGILPMKVVSRYLLRGEKITDIRPFLYSPIVIPRNRQLLDLLKEFKTSKVHIAVVIDEYGGTEGIITMEDILEEVVGDIFDETDEIEMEYLEKSDGRIIVDGSMNLDDFFELIDYREEFETGYTTVAGFCQEILNRFAVTGDEFDFSHYHVRVLGADEFTVQRVELTDLNPDGKEID